MAGIYLHIPFCRKACNYCNFHFSTFIKLKDDVLRAMHIEIALQSKYLEGLEIDTIYFGGGTPSFLTAGEINSLVESIYKNYRVGTLKECTLEANPDDLSPSYLMALKSTPVDRLSIGVQSFRQEDLLFMNRAHSAAQAEAAIKTAQDVGFDNLSIDLIYGVPNLDDNAWLGNLNKVSEYGIPHLSCYALTVEQKTALHHAILHKKTAPLDASQAAGQFELLMEWAGSAGYDHYEISNFAVQGKHAVHNTSYWLGVHYLGIGPAAHSYDGDTRQWNIANNAQYVQCILGQNALKCEVEVLREADKANEYIMTALRTMWGLDMAVFAARFNEAYSKSLNVAAMNYIDNGMMIKEGDKLILTRQGKLFADAIASELFVD